MRARLAAALIASSLVAPATAPAAVTRIGFARCDLTVDTFQTTRARVREEIPSRYTPLTLGFGSNGAGVAVWVFDCPRFGSAGHSIMSFVGPVVRDPKRQGETRPSQYHHVLLWAHATAAAAALLNEAGLAVTSTRTLERSEGHRWVTKLGGHSPGFTITAPRHRELDRPHTHSNRWWQTVRAGRARMDLSISNANDRLCTTTVCSRITTPAGSPLARLLGARRKNSINSFQHLPVSGSLRIVGP